MGSDRVLVRLSGELGVKSRSTRQRFVRRLVRNLRAGLDEAGVENKIHNEWGRLLVDGDVERVLPVAQRIFGVHSVSPIHRFPWNELEGLVAEAAERARPAVVGQTFAVRARRGRGRQAMGFQSPDVERLVGAELAPSAAGVDLRNPDVEVELEIHRDGADLAVERRPGPGGFPAGVQGRALALVSGGFDSLVAAWMVMRRGVSVDALFCNLGEDSQRDAVLRPLEVLRRNWAPGMRLGLTVVDFQEVAEDLKRTVPAPLHQVVLKRLMLRAANVRAASSKAMGIVTGECIGQVSSQTLANLAVIDRATDRVVLRPLLGFDKDEITARARRIGTFDLSALVQERCDLGAVAPTVRARLRDVEKAEADLDAGIFQRALDGAFEMVVGRETVSDDELLIEVPPHGAGVVDLRGESRRRRDPLPHAVPWDWAPSGSSVPDLESERPWVTVCEIGWKSVEVAARLRRAGRRAWALRGGARAWTRWAAAGDLRRVDPADEELLRAMEFPALRETSRDP